ncbi:quinone oxidoreductase family protein [Marinimicrococcus flavescens]|uniref:Quinone oxidoreductase n=1 Tax=Marinimicrococcus flavescens TaxID=3031815 RepID=A0AAP3XRA4_9PROT|nr:quinone oxidoreductase [Marinimicrococcus flavescens]
MSMRIVIHEHGGPDVLKVEDHDPGRPGPGEALVRHSAVGLNFIDTYFRTGLYPPAGGLPFTPGNEAAGVVEAVGEGVTEVKAGQRVAYATSLGAYAAERVMPAKALLPLPDAIADEQAAAMMLKGMTAQYLLRQTYRVKEGDTILIHAAAGGVGLIATQWAKHLGATVIGTAGSKEKAEIARAHGADYVILYKEEDFAERVKEITNGKKLPVVYDGVGKATFMGSLDCLRPRGLMVSYGNASGAVDAFNLGILAQKGSLFVTRPTLFGYTSTREELVACASDLFDVVAKGAVKIEINQRFKLAEAADAHRAIESRATTGSTVLLP